MKNRKSETKLENILYDFAMSQTRPDAKLLEEFVERYPEYALELSSLATDLILDDELEPINEQANLVNCMQSPMVSRVMSRFQNALFALKKSPPQSLRSENVKYSPSNPFASLSSESFRTLKDQLNVSTLFLTRLRDRLINPKTLPKKFLVKIADTLKVDLQSIADHFTSPPEIVSANQFYASKDKPQLMEQQSFDDAVLNSGLNEEQINGLLKLKENQDAGF